MHNNVRGDNRHEAEKGKIPKFFNRGGPQRGNAATQHTQNAILFISTLPQFEPTVKYFFII
jgi:hypothetical protein